MQDWIGRSIGRYQIVEQLGEGGMAVVYRAFDTNLERSVAVKMIRTDEFAPVILEKVLQRFEREARSLAKLIHPNIIPLIDFGKEDQVPYLVMPLITGGTLKQITGQAIAHDRAANILIPIAQALSYAHSQGVIHRDIKPSNILLTETGSPLLTDFGIAKLLDVGEGMTLTGTGVGIGTPEYMAPEQGLGNPVDERADVYSLGVVFYELITGRKPFTADTPMAVVLKQVYDPIPRPRLYAADIPDEVEQLLFKAMAKNAGDRYASMQEFAAALSRVERTAVSVPPIPAKEPARTGPLSPETASLPRLYQNLHENIVTRDGSATGAPIRSGATGPLGRTPLPAQEEIQTRRAKPAGLWAVSAAAVLLVLAGIWLVGKNLVASQTAAAVQATQAAQATAVSAAGAQASSAAVSPVTATGTPTATLPPSTPTLAPSPTSLPVTPTFNPQPTALRLTSNNSNDIQPSFSPDGEKIVFISNRDANPEIYIMDADGGNQKRLTSTPKIEEDLPGFSPDGTKIIFGILNGVTRDLYMMDVDGRNVVNLTNTPDVNEGRPRVMSAPPLKIIFDAAPVGSETWNIYSGVIADNRLGSINQLSMKEGYLYKLASFLPDQNTFVSRREGIGKVNSSRVIRHDLNSGEEVDISGGHTTFIPQVSPDGKWVFFVSYQGNDCLLFRVSTTDWSIAQVPLKYIDIGGIAVSPDGQWLVLSIKQEDLTLDLFRLSFP